MKKKTTHTSVYIYRLGVFLCVFLIGLVGLWLIFSNTKEGLFRQHDTNVVSLVLYQNGEISLPENPTTGYMWKLIETLGTSATINPDESTFLPASSYGWSGTEGTRVFHVTTHGLGETTFVFQHVHVSDPSLTPATTRKIKVVVHQ